MVSTIVPKPSSISVPVRQALLRRQRLREVLPPAREVESTGAGAMALEACAGVRAKIMISLQSSAG
ncbi:hypothetical protein [Nonomuraea sp. NPDC003754]